MVKRSRRVTSTGSTPETLLEKEKEPTGEKLTPAPVQPEKNNTRKDLKTILAMIQDDLNVVRPLLSSLALREYSGGLLIYIRSADSSIGWDGKGNITLNDENVNTL